MAHHAEAPVIPPVRARMHRFQNRRDGTDALRRCHDEERAQVIDRQSPYVRHGHDHTPLRHTPAPRVWHLFVKVCPYRFCGKDGTDAWRRCHDEERAQVIDRTTPLSLMSLR